MMNTVNRFVTTGIIPMIIACTFSVGAMAQDDKASQAQDDEYASFLEEVVVTASKREVNLQDLAMSIKALSQEDLKALGADTFTDYARMVPSLSFAERGSNRNSMVIRGLGPSVGLPVIGYYVDGVPQQLSFENLDPRLFDIGRIEILRGPQGTLYGEGSLGGTIRVISNRPKLDVMEGTVQIEYADIAHGGNSQNVSGMINLPIVKDKFGIRLVALDRQRDGYIDFPVAGEKDANTDNATDFKMLALWQPNDVFDATLIYYQQDADIEFDQAISPTFAEATGADPLTSSAAFGVMWDWTTEQLSLELNFDTGIGDLNITAGNSNKERSLIDDLFGPALIDNTEDVTSVEARLVSSNPQSQLKWVGGVFYRTRDSDIFADLPGIAGLFGVPKFEQVLDNQYDAYAFFGEATWAFNQRWSVTGGARYFSEDIRTDSGQDLGIPGFETSSSVKNNFSNISPKLVLEMRPNDNDLYYSSVSQGYRSGGNNVDITNDPEFVDSFDEDRVTAYELGAKWGLSGGNLLINSAVFYNDWKDIQIQGILDNAALGFTTNGGDAHSLGIETDISWAPSSALLFSVGGSWVEAETDVPMQGGPKGSKLPNVPNVTLNASGSYTFAAFGDFDGNIRADFSHRGESYAQIPNEDGQKADSYEMLNARFSLRNADWEITLFMKNIFDVRGSSFALNDRDQVFIVQPRTIGIGVNYTFSSQR